MKALGSLAAATVLAASLPLGAVAATPAGENLHGANLQLQYPTTSSVDLGQATMFMQPDRQATLAGVQLFVGAGLNREASSDNGLAALTAECVMRTPVDTPFGRIPLNEAVTLSGGSLSYEVESRYTRFYVESQPDRLPALLGYVGAALAAPAFSQPTLGAAKTALDAKIDAAEKNPVTVGIDMFKQSYFVGGAGLPSLGTQANLVAFDAAKLQQFYTNGYRRAGATMTAVGDVTPQVTAAAKTLVAALPAGNAAPPVTTEVKPLSENSRRIITHRDVGAPWLVLGFAAPSPGDQDFAAMLVIETLLSNVFERNSATTLPAIERTIGALYLYDDQPSSMVVYVNGTEVEPTVALRELLAVAESLSSEPLRDDLLAKYKANAAGAFVTDTLSMNDRSWIIGNFVSSGVGPDYPNTVLNALNSLTAADIERVAKKYLERYTVAIVLPRPGADVEQH